MIQKKDNGKKDKNLEIGEHSIQVVKTLKYLGTTIIRKQIQESKKIKIRIAAANRTYRAY